MLGFLAAPLIAAEADVTTLPAPATAKIDFDRDIKPIFQASCLRCHGPEKPKSRFRLDNRESALKGGENNSDDIVPGNSARSRLIHYVARLVKDMEMPPPGKGQALAPEQVAKLRAWIDQGADWGAGGSFPQTAISVSPAVRWLDVGGDRKKFRELEGMKEGWGGGAEYFSAEERLSPDKTLATEGHVLFPGPDVLVKLTLDKNEVGFVRGGFEEWRTYYDDTGGFYRPFTPPSFDLDRDLHLDTGRAWVDVGLTRPNLPQIVLGYEFQFQDGAKSMLEWGGVSDAFGNVRNIYPAAKEIHEQVHIVKLDVTHEVLGWHFEDNARVEFDRDRTHDTQASSFTPGFPATTFIVQTRQEYDHVRGANTVRLEKQITDWWFASGGYLYSRLEGESSMNQVTVDGAGAPAFGNLWSDHVTLRRESHAFSLANLFRPCDGLSLSLGAQAEFSRQDAFGNIHEDFGDPTDPGSIFAQPATVRSDLDETKTSENAELRYTRIPFTVLFADGRFAQDRIGQFEEEAGGLSDAFLRNTDFFNQRTDTRAGFNTSPWRWMAFNAHYRHSYSDSDYNHTRDSSPSGGEGYSAFIRHRDITTDEVEARLVLRPKSWLKATLTYQWTASDFFTTTDPVVDPFYGNVSPGGRIRGGTYDAQTYGLSLVFTPSSRFYFSGAFTYAKTRTVTWAQDEIPSILAPYRGATYSVIASANYAVNLRTTLQGTYSFSEAGYGQNNVANGLPLGLDYTRHSLSVGLAHRWTEWLSSNLRYSFYRYTEPSTGGFNDFSAHGVFATVAVRWP